MIVAAGECPKCGEWLDKCLWGMVSIAPSKFKTTCKSCGQEVWVETVWASESLDGKFFRRVEKVGLDGGRP